ncbi:MAG: enoyl-[acyl-carrier-protein] reductase FabI [Zetaproteobacteria bacterium CG06_land_8_20_14_3_00_59_53]|nr:MAG: enoyl-[acyl-carrier-protein] reductase FabI [Zetaproteobacteria bacterium CG23_combo_of_CG06-09_8_20_14_all_59_86]PIU69728.1 MAG: enoyl-[acyl-carrier-protein] reductase FabI [Zetaproteobacteria bacterium CG06_land_8_20_14_3_00_59_53]PIU96976.1 MAG: enoyl-[acyl-carrier-protein] reductase FabI [Zetaproteobacteria bacterium CG03_land_8_20_14_0_80_59_51]PIY47642.1 MAG: enoyl-[acyl-carrier-protein] reductase FabI [Zetaproteobacteria bacterium CG_4_10_14_0_8_um_filter_59_127]PJC17102.1 MAG: e
MGILTGKKGLILGVANDKSIAWGVAQACKREGAEIGFNYLGDMMEKRVRPLAEEAGATFIEPLDVSDDAQMDAFFAKVEQHWGMLDFMVHSIAFANKDALRSRFSETTRADFQFALDVSAYSFIACAQRAARLMSPGGSMVTMSYLGAVRAVPNYNVMGVAKAALEASTRYLAQDLGRDGIRVNALSAGPIRTLAASAVGDFCKLMDKSARGSMLGRNVSQDEVGNATAFLLSDMASGISGEVHYVDAGFHVGAGDPGVE